MSRRRLSDEEHALWRGVTRSIAPLRRRRVEDEAAEEKAKPSAPAARPRPRPVATPLLPAAPPKPAAPPPLAPLGRKMRHHIARGRRAIDGRLDLHGMSQAEAHGALLHFLHSRQARGAKLVLVITGKGAGDAHSSGRGILKRMVPMWLALPEFRSLVVGFESAAVGHGGEGALYISLRRPR